MNRASSKIELLAPAKDINCAFAAINAGADAVYIGAEAFGARQKASNSLEDIKEIVNYAHKFMVKVYVTVNTILFDEEIDKANKLIWNLYEAGVDAVIFQDMGLLKTDLPPIPLHASTQCNIDSLEKVKFLESCNVERVVLPREFSVKDIENITQKSDIEIEVFIHGALCACISGQCYMSAYIGGRSANRGECAQPCRKKYSIVGGKGKKLADSKYVMSMKDLSMAEHLEELIDAGVSSLKIEGRLKDEDYVKNVVSFYRKKLDAINPELRPSNGILINDFMPDINKTFNRTYTDYNASGKIEKLTNPDTPKFLGEKIGTVKNIVKSTIELNTKVKLTSGDGLSFFDKNGELCGTTVMTVNGSKIQVRDASNLCKNSLIYRNYDLAFIKKLKKTVFTRKLPLKIHVLSSVDGLWITLNDEYTYTVNKNYESAKNIEKAQENLKAQFSKLGDTEFIVDEIIFDEDFDFFIPVSELNALRRDFIENYRTFLCGEYHRRKRATEIKPAVFPVKELNYTFNISNTKAREFYKDAGAQVNEGAFETGSKGEQLFISRLCFRRELGICPASADKDAELFLVDEFGKKFRLGFDCKNCKMTILSQ